jgi:pyrimidine-nucleoside phosphorylase
MSGLAFGALSAPDLIKKKRDGGEHSPEELTAWLEGFLRGDVKEYQMAAWLMAVFFRGMSPSETREWTRLMWRSGTTFPRATHTDFWIDKHSTGGVGDKTSLILVPWVTATCNRLFGEGAVKIPMVSGRGLGHSGGTLDKLESVSGFSPALGIDRALTLLTEQGFFMMGQTQDLAPADRLLYAMRDVTATVECVPLIVSSILSKKLSENLDGLVLDVKVGGGAFMKSLADARTLASALVGVAAAQGLKVAALLTRMDEPLGTKVGHQLEIEECADFLSGAERDRGMLEVCTALAAQMVSLASRGKLRLADAAQAAQEELNRDSAHGLFRRMLESQGGNWADFERLRRTEDGLRIFEARSPAEGFLEKIDALAIGTLVHDLGGGRSRKEDAIDPRVGVAFAKKCGDSVRAGEVLARVYYRTEEQLSFIRKQWERAVLVSSRSVDRPDWVLEVLHE